MHNLYDKQGRPISLEEYSRLFGDKSYQIIRQTRLEDGTHVSTVWLGIDHSFGGEVPVIFETLVTRENSDEEEMYRYTSEKEAIAHHEFLCGNGDVKEERGYISRWKQISLDID